MSTKLEDLTPEVQTMAKKLISDLKEAGIKVAVVYTYRTEAEQVALYAQGRETLDKVNEKRKKAGMYLLPEKENKYTVTKCDGIKLKSAHQSREALDIAPVDDKGKIMWDNAPVATWRKIAELSKAVGFDCGATWPPLDKNGLGWDKPHHQKKA